MSASGILKSDLKRKSLFGYEFLHEDDLSVVATELTKVASTDDSAVVVTPNVDILIDLTDNPTSVEAKVYKDADYCLPDGQPIVWASKILGDPLASRLPGSSLFSELWPMLKDRRIPVTMLASSEEVVDFFTLDYDLANFKVAPWFSVTDEIALAALVESVIKKAISNKSRVIFCGIGQPKDSCVIEGVQSSWKDYSEEPVPIFFALGASYLFYAGLQQRAPEWMQSVGLEWFHRFTQEPKRLFHRYFIRSPKFLKIVWDEYRTR